MTELTCLRFHAEDEELMSRFREFRASFAYPFPEDRCPADAALFMVMRNGRIAARAAILPNKHMATDIAVLGFFEAKDDREAVHSLFTDVEDYCRAAGKKRLVGPMNGSTWQSYRIALPFGEPFLMDVVSQPYYLMLFEENGFQTISDYLSSKAVLEPSCVSRWEERHKRLLARGFSIYTLDMKQVESQLKEIHALSLDAFSKNFLYTPISEEQFMAKYVPLMAAADPRFIFLLRNSLGHLVGFHFAMRNLLNHETTELIQKTIALASELRGEGIGSFLMEHCRREALLNGYSSVIHALMHTDNVSAKFQFERHRVIRRYKLYGKEIS